MVKTLKLSVSINTIGYKIMQNIIELGQIYQETAGEKRFGRASAIDDDGWVELLSPNGKFTAHARHIQPSQWSVSLANKSAVHIPSGTEVKFISVGTQQWKLEIPNDKLSLGSTREKKSFGKEAYNAFLAEFEAEAEKYGMQ